MKHKNTKYDKEHTNSVLRNIWQLEKALGYNFKNPRLLLEALTHKSFNQPFNNERLEFLGDAVLDLIVGDFLFRRFRNKKEGTLSKMRASLVNEKSLSKIANNIGLGEHLRLSNSESSNGGRLKPSILSSALEALISVIYLESGLQSVKNVFYPIMQKNFEISEDSLFKDYKSSLQEFTQGAFGCIPIYELIGEEGPDHNKSFTVRVIINGDVYAQAKGSSKKNAQQEAAKLSLEYIKKYDKD